MHKRHNRGVKNVVYLWFISLIAFSLLFGCQAGGDKTDGRAESRAPDAKQTKGTNSTGANRTDDQKQTQGRKEQSERQQKQPWQSKPKPPADPLKAQISKMSLEEKIGQLVFTGVDGYTSDEHAKQLIQTYRVGGVILFERNIQDAEQTRTLLNALKKLNGKNKVPLFFGVDEEGGTVSRMPDSFVPLPTSERIGTVNDRTFSYEIGRVIAREIKTLGFNTNFAPVLDINSNPDNPVIGDRSFGATAKVVSKLGLATLQGMKAERVIPVVKHFPGHGDTSVDSHVGLPVVTHDVERLDAFELVPFKQAIAQGADAVMIAHILLPQLDPDHPASLSKAVITDLLREQLAFDGVVVSDDLTMGAIVEQYDIGEAAVTAVAAGTDLLLVCHEYDNTVAVIEALRKAVADRTLSEQRIDESVYRILALKRAYRITDLPVDRVGVASINRDIEKLLQKYAP